MKHLNFLEEMSKSGKTKVITILSMHDDTNLGKIIWSGALNPKEIDTEAEEILNSKPTDETQS